MANTRILCVDDEEKILKGIQRQQGDDFDISIAVGPLKALEMIDLEEPFAVVISDMRMPDMNGVELLAIVREKSPDTVRMILTGYAELSSTIEAVNEGNIFRFLSKPCEENDLAAAFDAALRQYALVESEKELVEGTLHGSVKVLSEVLSLVCPLAFGQSTRIRTTVDAILNRLHVDNAWQVEIAAMLSALGCVTLPRELLDKKMAGQVLTHEEEKVFSSHPSIAGELLRTIPRLDRVAEIIESQNGAPMQGANAGRKTPLECDILRIAIDFDFEELRSNNALHALTQLKKNSKAYDDDVFEALAEYVKSERNFEVVRLNLHEVRKGMVLAQDIKNQNGALMMSKGQEITMSAVRLLENFSANKTIEGPIDVVVSHQKIPMSVS